ncbi:MauE/DoxX family redox-associated membrane protein [Streptomyces chattanoogensis]|uniref:MauE/DoxX family redox-associated membrane protein n=1 Tax=Streptomyces chattanoogensis TaxID=66876 RepID=UPI00368F02E5
MTAADVFLGCQVYIGIVFLASVIGKTRTRARYADFVEAVHDLAPGLPPRATARAVVVAEAVTVALIGPRATSRAAFILAFCLLVAFTMAISRAIRRSRRVRCQCFGASSAPVGPLHIVRNLMLLGGAATGGLTTMSLPTPPGAAGAATATLCAAVVSGITLRTDDIAELFRPTT